MKGINRREFIVSATAVAAYCGFHLELVESPICNVTGVLPKNPITGQMVVVSAVSKFDFPIIEQEETGNAEGKDLQMNFVTKVKGPIRIKNKVNLLDGSGNPPIIKTNMVIYEGGIVTFMYHVDRWLAWGIGYENSSKTSVI